MKVALAVLALALAVWWMRRVDRVARDLLRAADRKMPPAPRRRHWPAPPAALVALLLAASLLSGCSAVVNAVAIPRLDVLPPSLEVEGGECVAWANDGSCQIRVSVAEPAP